MSGLHTTSPRFSLGVRAGDTEPRLRWTSTQERLLRERAEGAGPPPLVTAIELDGVVEGDRLDRAWQEIQRRQPFLRCRLSPEGPVISDQVRPLIRADLPGSSPRFSADTGEILATAARPRDLTIEGPAEAVLIRTGPEAYLLICAIDHLATDGWSFGLIAREWSAQYRTPSPARVLDPAGIIEKYAHPERLQAHRAAAIELAREFEGAQAFPLPPSQGRWALQLVELPLEIARGIRARAARERTTPFALALAVLGWALWIDHRTNDLIVSTHVANRSVPQSEQIVCAVYNTVPIRVSAPDGDNFDSWLASAKQASVRALQRQSVPFSMAREALPDALPADALLRAMINFDEHPFLGFVLPGVEIHEASAWNQQRIGDGIHAPWYSTSTRAWPAGITVSFRETWDALQLHCHYGCELGDRGALMLLGRVTEGLALLTDSTERDSNG